VEKLPKLVAVKGLWDPQRQTETDCQDAEECKRKDPLNLVQSNIGLLKVFETIEYRDLEQLGGGNHCFINEKEILVQSPFIWPLLDSKNRSIIGAGATN
jgi:hypothetical protein